MDSLSLHMARLSPTIPQGSRTPGQFRKETGYTVAESPDETPSPEQPPWLLPNSDNCWLCGQPGQYIGGYIHRCVKCNVEWQIPYAQQTKEQWEQEHILWEKCFEKTHKLILVDFTRPDAPSSP